MKANEAIREIMKETNVSQSTLANRTGLTRQAVYERLKQKSNSSKDPHSLATSAFVQLVKGLDYKVVVMPSSARTPKDSYEVDG